MPCFRGSIRPDKRGRSEEASRSYSPVFRLRINVPGLSCEAHTHFETVKMQTKICVKLCVVFYPKLYSR
jgi:hypothetical protein